MFFQSLGVLWTIASSAGELLDELEAAAADGTISADEAAAVGVALSDCVGNIQVVINGRDIVRTTAQREVFSALARVARQLLIAKGLLSG